MATRIWLWPNLLSLDAPLVAVLWQILFLRCFHATAGASHNALPSVLLVSVVWLIYAADRALDAWRGFDLRPRHEFYRRHWRALLPLWIVVLLATSWFAWRSLPPQLFERGAWLLAAVLVYFGIVHCSHLCWPKEAGVAAIFGLGASLAAWTRVETSYDVLTVVLFACLCWINCAAISEWEARTGPARPTEQSETLHPSAEPGSVVRARSMAPRTGKWPIGVLAACVGFAAIAALHRERPILCGAEAASAAAFILLDRGRFKLSADALRVLADVALLSPVFFLPLAGSGV